MSTLQRVISIVRRAAGLKADEPVAADTGLVRSGLWLDSVAVLELVVALEKEFGVELDRAVLADGGAWRRPARSPRLLIRLSTKTVAASTTCLSRRRRREARHRRGLPHDHLRATGPRGRRPGPPPARGGPGAGRRRRHPGAQLRRVRGRPPGGLADRGDRDAAGPRPRARRGPVLRLTGAGRRRSGARRPADAPPGNPARIVRGRRPAAALRPRRPGPAVPLVGHHGPAEVRIADRPANAGRRRHPGQGLAVGRRRPGPQPVAALSHGRFVQQPPGDPHARHHVVPGAVLTAPDPRHDRTPANHRPDGHAAGLTVSWPRRRRRHRPTFPRCGSRVPAPPP